MVNNKFSYRCRNRKWGILISIDETNLKILYEKKEKNFDYQTNNKEHICDKSNISINIKDVLTQNENYKLTHDLL